jgi:hypothetical protein
MKENYQTKYHKEYYKKKSCIHLRLFPDTYSLLKDKLNKHSVSLQEFLQQCCILAIKDDPRMYSVFEEIQRKRVELEKNHLIYKNEDGLFEIEYDPDAIYKAIESTLQTGEMPDKIEGLKSATKKRGALTKKNKEDLEKEIIDLYKSGKHSVKELASMFFTSYGNVWNILNANNLTKKKKKQHKEIGISSFETEVESV